MLTSVFELSHFTRETFMKKYFFKIFFKGPLFLTGWWYGYHFGLFLDI